MSMKWSDASEPFVVKHTPDPKPEPVTLGRIVHYITHDGTERPAIVVRVFEPLGGVQLINLQVFLDGSNDRYVPGIDSVTPSTLWATSVHQDESSNKASNTWHWPERV